MKKFILILIVIIAIIAMFIYYYANYKQAYEETKKQNEEYEQYLNKEIYGTDIASIINKAINQNEKNKIEVDENGQYIENGETSINIEIYITDNETKYNMQILYNGGIENFVKNYNFIKFKSAEVQYHEKTGKIKYILFNQITS